MPCGGRIQRDWSEGESQKGVGGNSQEDVEGYSEDAEMNTKMDEEGNRSGNGGRRNVKWKWRQE
jgi:hypothetical protein